MKFYKMTVANNPEATIYAGTRRDAQGAAKERPESDWIDVLIEEVNVQTDKAGMVAALNGEPIEASTGASWTMTTRGALVEGK